MQEVDWKQKLAAGPAAAEAVMSRTLTFRNPVRVLRCGNKGPQTHRPTPRQAGSAHPNEAHKKSRPRNHLPANWTSPQRDSAIGLPRPLSIYY